MTSPVIGESSCYWHSSHEEALINICDEEFDMGRMGSNNTFSTKQFTEFSLKLSVRTGRVYDPSQIKSKWTRMKSKTNTFHKLINTTGFGWNPETNTVTAEESVWDTYLKVRN